MLEPRWLESDFSDRLASVTRAPLIFTAHWEECWLSSQVLIMKNMKDRCGTKCQARLRTVAERENSSCKHLERSSDISSPLLDQRICSNSVTLIRGLTDM